MLTIPAQLTLILTGLRAAIGAFMSRRNPSATVVWLGTQAYVPVPPPQTIPPIPAETWYLLHARLGCLLTRFTRLFDHWKSGTLPKPRPGRRAQCPSRIRPAYQRLPTRHAWIVAHVGHHAAGHASQLAALLEQPETAAFAAAAPQAGRTLRPLCRMLGITPPACLRLPERPPRIRVRRARSAPARPADAPPDRKLPAYVRAAVRAWKSKNG